jgi:peptidyl-tRNA hydrolase, PTH1 family
VEGGERKLKLIIGLGNPGKKYDNTRHNVGFEVIDKLASSLDAPLDKQKFNGIYGQTLINGEKVILLKPLTYMNLSGESVRPLMDYFDIDVEDIVVIYDDLDLATGVIRLRQKGSPGGHNGMKSLVQHLGTEKFKRVRIGISRPTNGMSVPNYVLGTFNKDEQPLIDEAIEKSAAACKRWIETPFIQVMNEYNG